MHYKVKLTYLSGVVLLETVAYLSMDTRTFSLNLYVELVHCEAKWFTCNYCCTLFLMKCQCSLSHTV